MMPGDMMLRVSRRRPRAASIFTTTFHFAGPNTTAASAMTYDDFCLRFEYGGPDETPRQIKIYNGLLVSRTYISYNRHTRGDARLFSSFGGRCIISRIRCR